MSIKSAPTQEQTERVAQEWVAVEDAVGAYIGSMVRRAVDRDDLMQQTALYVIEHAADYTGSGFLHWAIQVARYRVLEHWQGGRHDDRLKKRLQVVADAFVRVVEPDDARGAALKTCLARLSDDQRRLMERRYVDDVPLHQLAAELKRPPNSMANAFYRIRNALALCIRKEMDKEDPAP